uniref:Uncharacterized protein n=1 Tax=Manihot esculenta TaxID=3983 RepID=A0A2C9VB25_MANES
MGSVKTRGVSYRMSVRKVLYTVVVCRSGGGELVCSGYLMDTKNGRFGSL